MSEPAPTALVASNDGRWLALRRGTQVAVVTTNAPEVRGTLELPTADVDLALVGTPAMLAIVTVAPPAVQLYRLPQGASGEALLLVAQLDLPSPSRIAAITGPRLALLSGSGKVAFVRVTARALAMQTVDPGSPVDLAVGLDRDQVLMALTARRIEVWDAAVNRPALRLQLQLPAAPRVVGAAKGHLWAYRTGDEDIYIFRLSDGRPFRHHAGAPILGVASTLASPYVVVTTSRGLVRLNCFAHSMHALDAPWSPGTAMTMIGADEDVTLVGLPAIAADGSLDVWRSIVARSPDEPRMVPGGPSVATAPRPRPPTAPGGVPTAAAAPAPAAPPMPDPFAPPPATHSFAPPPGGNPFAPAAAATNPFAPAAAATNPFAPAAAAANPFAPPPAANPFAPPAANPFAPPPAAVNPFAPTPAPPNPFAVPGDGPTVGPTVGPSEGPGAVPPPEPYLHSWRAPFVARGIELLSGAVHVEVPVPDPGSELDTLARRFTLDLSARRTLATLYAYYLVGAPAVPLARLAQIVGDWTEPLGRGALGAMAVLRHQDGTVALRDGVTGVLDGRAPRTLTLLGSAAAAVAEPGEFRLGRDSRPDAEIAAELASKLGKIGLCHGDLASGVLEATLHAAVAVSFQPPLARPLPWPRAATLVLVMPASPMSWIADLPLLVAR